MSTLKGKDAEKGEKGEVKIHTTLTREIRPDSNFHELMERWQAAVTLGDMLGVLHRGYGVSLERWTYDEKEYDEIDRHIFYFTIADGWADHYLLKLPEDGRKEYEAGCDRKTPSELRQQLARKAFDMLCLNFFKMELIDRGYSGNKPKAEWEETIVSERLFPVIQNFFRAQKAFSGRIEIRNLSRFHEKRSRKERLAVDFLVNLAEFIWGWRELDDPYFSDDEKYLGHLASTRARIDTAKPWMVEVLSYLDRLDVLRKWILELNKACLAKLKGIALRNEFTGFGCPVVKSRPVATVDEACYLGSGAGWLLKEYELKVEEHERLTAILDAERQIEEASQQIKELANAK